MDLKKKLLILAIILFSFFLLLKVADWLRADISYSRGRAMADAGYLFEAEESFLQAIRLWPNEPAYHREMAAVFARLAQVSAEEEQEQLLDLASQEAGKSLNLNPLNLLTLKSLVSTYFTLAQIDSSYWIQTEDIVQRAINLCPTDPTLWYFKALVLLGEERFDEAKTALDEALRLKPDYVKAKEARELLPVL